jgi:hypothetical protein
MPEKVHERRLFKGCITKRSRLFFPWDATIDVQLAALILNETHG